MQNRPDNITLLLFFSAGIVTACYSYNSIMVLTVYILLGVIYLISPRYRLLIIIFLTGSMVYIVHNKKYVRISDQIERHAGKEIVVHGTLSEVREYGMSSSVILHSDSVEMDGNIYEVNTRFNAYLNRTGMGIGDSLEVKGKIRAAEEPLNKYEPDRKFLASVNNISAEIGNASIQRYSKCRKGYDHIIRQSRNKVREIFRRRLSFKAGNFLFALIMGDKNGIEASQIKAFADSGTIHLLAVSGLHVGFVILLTGVIGSFLRLSKWPNIIFSSVILLLYSMFTGGSPSLIRAVLMAIILMLSRPLKRKIKFSDIIGSAGIISLAYEPNQIFKPGFILSFAAVMSIALIYDPLLCKLKQFKELNSIVKGKISGALLLSFSVTIGLLPFVLYLFGRYNFISIVSNLILIPLTGAAFMSGILLLMTDKIGIIAEFLSDIIDLVTYLITFVTEYTAGVEVFTLHRYFDLLVTAAFIITIAAVFYIKKYRRKILFISASIMLMIYSSFTFDNSPTLYVFKTHKGKSSIFINNGETILFADGLESSDIRNIIISYINKSNIENIDYLITGDEWYQTEELLKLIGVPVKYVVSENDHSFINGYCDHLRISDLGGSLKTVFSEIIPSVSSFVIRTGGDHIDMDKYQDNKGLEIFLK